MTQDAMHGKTPYLMDVLGWHVVSDENGTVLAFYGERLLASAQERARYLEATTGQKTYLHLILGTKPVLGGSISMRGVRLTPR